MFGHQFNLFNVNPATKKHMVISASLTLSTLCCLASIALGDSSHAENCEQLIARLHQQSHDPLTGTIDAAFKLTVPMLAFLNGGPDFRRSKTAIAHELADQDICSDYIEQTYHFKANAKIAAAMYQERMANCKEQYGDGIRGYLCEHEGEIFLLLLATNIILRALAGDGNDQRHRPRR